MAPNFLGETILQSDWIIWFPLFSFDFKSIDGPNNNWLDSTWLSRTFLIFSRFLEIQKGDLISCGEGILENRWIICFPSLYFNLKNLSDITSLSFIRFDWILPDSAVLFSYFENFLQFKMGDLISGGNQFCRTAELFSLPFCILVLKGWTT